MSFYLFGVSLDIICKNIKGFSFVRIFYGRVSSDLDSQDSSYLRQQELGESMGCDLILLERESGRTDSRSEYQKLIRLIKDGQVREVVATRSDRLFRNYQESNYFYALCEKYQVAWTFTDEPEISSNSPYSSLLRKERAFAAERESERLGERQKKAYKHAETQRKVFFRKPPLGYLFNKGKAVINDEIIIKGYSEAQIMVKLVEFYLEKQSLRGAIKAWKIWLNEQEIVNLDKFNRLIRFTASGFKEWLISPIIRGHTRYGRYHQESYGERLDKLKTRRNSPDKWRIAKDTHPPLISEETFTECEKILQRNRNKGLAIAASVRTDSRPVSLGSILRCTQCRCRFTAVSSRQKDKTYRYYYCQGRKQFNCSANGISEVKLRESLKNTLIKNAQSLLKAIERANSSQLVVDDPETRRIKREAKEARDKYEQLGIEAFLILANTLESQIERKTDNFVTQNFIDPTLIESLQNPEFWETLTLIELHEVFLDVVRCVWVEDGKIQRVEVDF